MGCINYETWKEGKPHQGTICEKKINKIFKNLKLKKEIIIEPSNEKVIKYFVTLIIDLSPVVIGFIIFAGCYHHS